MFISQSLLYRCIVVFISVPSICTMLLTCSAPFATLYAESSILQVGAIVLLVIYAAVLHQILANFLRQLLYVQFDEWNVVSLHVLYNELSPARHVEVGYLGLNVVQISRLLEVLLDAICEVLYCALRQLLDEICL